jgi:ABC-type uncharacterized transport system permease subunit
MGATPELVLALLGVLAIAGAWAIAFFANLAIGALSLYTQSSIKLIDAWLAGYFVMSGYLVPLSLFPPLVRDLPYWLPFRYQLGFPRWVVGSRALADLRVRRSRA